MKFMTRYGMVNTTDMPSQPVWLGMTGWINQVYIPLQVVGAKYLHEPDPDPDRSPA